MTNEPCASEIDGDGTSVATLRAVTVAPGTTASEVSLTVPNTVARSTWAEAFDRFIRNTAMKTSRPRSIRFMKILQG